ncbi:BNI3L protein, partial [Geococcyx californianus]|nr:BNI3L protein [Geococcyx californianus]
MLLEAQLETESSEGTQILLESPAWNDSDGTHTVSEQPGQNEPQQVREKEPCAAPAKLCSELLHTCFQRNVPEDTKRRKQHMPASLAWACARRPRHLSPKEFAFVCPPQPVLWSLQGGVVERKKRLFSSELLLLFIPSLLLSHLLTLGLGIYIGKQLAASSANPL